MVLGLKKFNWYVHNWYSAKICFENVVTDWVHDGSTKRGGNSWESGGNSWESGWQLMGMGWRDRDG